MILVWKYLSGKLSVNSASLFQLAQDASDRYTRSTSDSMIIKKPVFMHDVRKYFFSVRVVDKWNALPYSLRSASNMESFKELYDKHFSNQYCV